MVGEMKRSEMVKILKEIFNKYENPSVIAEHALTTVEQAGMLPPTLCYDAVDTYVNIKDTEILHDNDVTFMWEPEE